MRKRSRACKECHRLKIKCDVSTTPGQACDRCSRGSLACVPAAPRLQRDRIHELEAQVQELETALRNQTSSTSNRSSTNSSSSSSSGGTTPGWSSGGAGPRPDNDDDDGGGGAVLAFLDARISPRKQQELLVLVANQVRAAWPFVRLPLELDALRAASPVLLLVALAYGPPQAAQGTDSAAHDELLWEAARVLGVQVLGRGRRSLDTVQALLVAVFWNKPTRDGGQQGSPFQLVQIAADMAIDLGLGGPALQPAPPAYFDRHAEPESLDARRTWLACFVAQATAAISTRRPSPVPWDAHHHACLVDLESRGDAADVLLGQIVRVVRLVQHIADELRLCQLTAFVDGNDYDTHAVVEALAREVDEWAARVPSSLASCPTLQVWRHAAMVYVYEVALHTPTNKASFAAPFIPGRVAVRDFPRPPHPIPPLRHALGALVGHCHAVLETTVAMDPARVLGLPSFCFAPLNLYALFVLVTALVAAAGPANTYGACLGGGGGGGEEDGFRIEQCGRELQRLTVRLKTLDPTLSCWTTRMFDATSWLKEWYNDYSAILHGYKMSLVH